ncbi:DUF1033 family protein [Metasolibacillus meyeri]|uniref:DUF1033 family protein n=1 Tax=Metasolibacillus meyeri TaxID=1071052 RepID=UPI001EE6C1F2|nr:DUF1033 family protein [Metasolibacillus meyeri]
MSKLYKIIYMKADYEPWWQFEGWEETIQETYFYETEEALEQAFQEMLMQYRAQYENVAVKHEIYVAFWTENECEYCDACDEDAQIYHGLIKVKSKK